MFESLLAILQHLIPLWLLALVLGFGYLLVLLRRASKAFLDISERQATFLRDRFDVLDISTGIFERTITRQETEIGRQKEEIDTLTGEVSELRAGMRTDRQLEAQRATEGLELLQDAVNAIAERQALLLDSLTPDRSGDASGAVERFVGSWERLDDALANKLERSRRTRDRSPYAIKVSHLKGASGLIEELIAAGYNATMYTAVLGGDEGAMGAIEDYAALWVGSEIPPNLVYELVEISRAHYPDLRYLRLSRDMSGPDYIHSTFLVGGNTDTARETFLCEAWSTQDFDVLRPDMSVSELHGLIRAKYPMSGNAG